MIGGIFALQLLAFLVLASLVGNAAAGLASGLARGLAFTATAIFCACTEILGFDSLDMLHDNTSIQIIHC